MEKINSRSQFSILFYYDNFVFRFRYAMVSGISAMMQIGNNINNLMLLVPLKSII